MTILVTAAAGNLGRTLVETLSRDQKVVAGLRNISTAIGATNVETRRLDYDDPTSFAGALEGINTIVLQAPPLDASADTRLGPFIDAIRDRNIRRVIFISAFGAQHNENGPLAKIEQRLVAADFQTTILRPSFFMENFTSGFAAPAIEHDGLIVSSAGDAKLAFISIKDIAAVVERLLGDDHHHGKSYDLTGPEKLSHQEIAEAIGVVQNKEIKYLALTSGELKASAMEHGVPEPAADYLIKLYDLAAKGAFAEITDDVASVTGNPPRPFARVLAD